MHCLCYTYISSGDFFVKIGVLPFYRTPQRRTGMASEEQKRGSDRLKHSFLAKFRIYSDASVKWEVVTIRNISPGGLSFNFTQKFAVGTALELHIGLTSAIGTVQCLGEVCRVDEMPPKRPDLKTITIYGIAVKFTNLPQDKKEAIERLIKESQTSGN